MRKLLIIAAITLVCVPLPATAGDTQEKRVSDCVSQVESASYKLAIQSCGQAFDEREAFINGHATTVDQVAMLVNNARAEEALGLSLAASGQGFAARGDFIHARIDANAILRSSAADAAARSIAQGIVDRTTGAIAKMPVVFGPQATPTPQSSCDHAAQPTLAVSPEYPDSARDMGIGPVDVLITVSLDANGTVEDASVQRSSGVAAIDINAERAAIQTIYSPRRANCVGIPGSYTFRVSFNPD